MTALFVTAGLSLVLILFIARYNPSSSRSSKGIRSIAAVELSELKAESLRRVESMSGCRIEVMQGHREGPWLCFLLSVQPPGAEVRWWPWGISLECPRLLALRDQAIQGEPMQGALNKWVAGHSLDSWIHGSAEITVRVELPAQVQELDIGYYGVPALRYQIRAELRR